MLEYLLYVVGMATILLGAGGAIWTGITQKTKGRSAGQALTLARVHLSQSLTLALTFILGAEILKTFRVPNIFQLIKVTLLVLLRQLITYFLDKDVLRLRGEFRNMKS